MEKDGTGNEKANDNGKCKKRQEGKGKNEGKGAPRREREGTGQGSPGLYWLSPFRPRAAGAKRHVRLHLLCPVG